MTHADYTDEASTFGDRIAAAREVLGLTQDELAQRLGVRTKTVREWEQDRAEPRSNRLQMLAGILNVSIIWLMSGQGQGLEQPAEPSAVDSTRQDVLEEIRRIKDDQVSLARRLARIERLLRSLP